MRILSGQFTIAKWEEQTLIERAELQMLNEADIEYTISGDLTGSLKGKYIMAYQNKDVASYCGVLIFEGEIDGKSGQFAIKETGQFEQGVAKTNWEILSGSGTNNLTTINGKGGYAATDRNVDYSLEINDL